MVFYLLLEKETVTTRKKLNVQRTRTSRLKKKLVDCESIIHVLRQQRLHTDNLDDAIREQFRMSDVDLFQNEVVNKLRPPEARRYSADTRRFATTVYFHSPAAYRYLRQFLTLPNEATLRKWLMNIDGLPGFTTMSLSIINKRIRTEEVEPDCVLICDSMSIRKQLIYNDHVGRYVGYVDIGDGCPGTKLAGEALVLLASGLKEKWRYPIGYFLVGK